MRYTVKRHKPQTTAVNKSLYLPEQMTERLLDIAYANDMSFNQLVISMMEFCLNDLKEEENSK